MKQAVSILGDLREAAKQAEQNARTVTTKTTNTAVDKAKARTAATQAARVPDELLRALGARGRGLDSGGRPYGLALLNVVENVAAEAFACGGRSQGKMCMYMQGISQLYVPICKVTCPQKGGPWSSVVGRIGMGNEAKISTLLPLETYGDLYLRGRYGGPGRTRCIAIVLG